MREPRQEESRSERLEAYDLHAMSTPSLASDALFIHFIDCRGFY
jgi:hypothetical protein